jgi:phosphoglucomutase
MDAVILSKVNNWLSGNYDQETKDEIIRLRKENPDELVDSFYQNLEFGTGGLRGIMGVGTNRINEYTIGVATQGYSNYLLQSFPNQQVKVAIAHDSRNNSRFYAETAAKVFAANGIGFFFQPCDRPPN